MSNIFLIVAKDSATDRINRLANLTREAHACERSDRESLKAYIERFSDPAAAYLNMVDADSSSAESQNFAVAMINNARLPSQVYTTVMAGMVLRSEEKPASARTTISVEKNGLLQAVNFIQKFSLIVQDIEKAVSNEGEADNMPSDSQRMAILSERLLSYKSYEAESCSLTAIFISAIAANSDSSEESHGKANITLADAIATLEEITILPD